jgi:carboxyl-terminal processing protease
MKRAALWAMYIIFLTGSFLAFAQPDTVLQSKPIYGRQAKLVTNLLETSHYRKLPFNDSLSSAILDSYLATLDNNRLYFLASDIAAFEKFRYSLDDLTKQEDVTPGFIIYKVFKTRFMERMNYVMNSVIKSEFDFSTNEYYESDREKFPWANTAEELHQQWYKLVKSQALSLKLTGKSAEEIQSMLTTRYDRYIKSVKQTTNEDVFAFYMNTITEAYDPHTSYRSPRDADDFSQQLSLSLEGIGARLQQDNEYTKVNEIITGGPADKSGLIHANDKIIAVGQGAQGELVDVVGWRIDEVVKLIKGPKGTTVKLQLLPAESGLNGPPVVITLVRDKINLDDLRAKKKVIETSQNGKTVKLGIITLPSFYMDFEAYQKGDPNYNSTSRDVKKLLGELKAENVQGVVLDLRNNGGGSLMEAIDLTGLFIKNGPVVQVRNSNNRIEVLADDDPSIVYSGPLVVLINRFSASASEIFAGAIQDYHRGVIAGETTFGKGTVQQLIDLNRYMRDSQKVGSLALTLQKFYRATGSSTQHRGVVPDIKLPSAFSSDQFGESSTPNALPWDEIRSSLFQRTPLINDKVIAELIKQHNQRMKTDPYLSRLIDEVEEAKKSISQTKISLNEVTRKMEMEEIEKKRAANKKLGGTTIDKEGKPMTNTLNMDDEYLREGLLILSDLIVSRIG